MVAIRFSMQFKLETVFKRVEFQIQNCPSQGQNTNPIRIGPLLQNRDLGAGYIQNRVPGSGTGVGKQKSEK